MNFKEYIEKDIEEKKSLLELLPMNTEARVNKYKETVTDIINNYNELLTSVKEYVDYNDNLLNEKIDNIDIGDLKIYDPTAGVINDLQIVINNLYQAGNKDGLTASEFDALDLTANEFDAYQITAYEFDSAGKTILV